MRRISQLLKCFLLAVVSILAVSCTKEQFNNGEGEFVGYTTLELALNLSAESQTKSATQGEDINDIKVWVYAMDNPTGASVNADSKPVAFVSASAEQGSNLNSGNSTSLSLELPLYTEAKQYRLFVVANEALLGTVYRARQLGAEQVELAMDGNLTYYELTTAVFDARKGNGIMTQLTDASAMPFSHWKDITIAAHTQGSSITPTTATIDMYRPVGKTEFEANLSSTSAPGASLSITNLYMHSSTDMAIAVQGAVFSDIADINADAVVMPGIFGNFSHFRVGYLSGLNLYNTSTNGVNSFETKVITSTTDLTHVGAIYLYENHLGETYVHGTTSTVSHSGYTPGAYYVEVIYNYSVPLTGGTSKTGTGVFYLPLPAVVRNHNYAIKATFDVTNEGSVILASYTVKPWTVSEESLIFSYPSITVWPEEQDANGYVYNKPVCRYKSGGLPEDGAFVFNFRMDAKGNQKPWTPHLNQESTSDPDFAMAVYKIDGTTETKMDLSQAISDYSYNYQIRIYPLKPYDSSKERTADLYITYSASWLGGAADELLINATSGGTLWPDSGGERYKIRVTQIQDLD